MLPSESGWRRLRARWSSRVYLRIRVAIHVCARRCTRAGVCVACRYRFTRAKAWGVAIGGAVLTPVCLTILTLQQLNVLPKS